MGAINSGYGTQQGQNPGTGGSGPPFAIGSAVNGLSVDPGSFAIVLGNDRGLGAAGPAKLLSDREIFADNFNLILQGPVDASVFLRGDSVHIFGTNIDSIFAASSWILNDGALSKQSTVSNTGFFFSDGPGGFDIAMTGGGFANTNNFTGETLNAGTVEITLANTVTPADRMVLNAGTLNMTNDNAGTAASSFDKSGASFQDGTATMFAALAAAALTMSITGGFSSVLSAGRLVLTGDNSTNGLQLVSNGATNISLTNVLLTNNIGSVGELFLTCSTYNANPYVGADALGFFNGGAGGVAVVAGGVAANMRFAVGGAAIANEIMRLKTTAVNITVMPTFASNALALAGGLVIGDLYKSAVGVVSIVI